MSTTKFRKISSVIPIVITILFLLSAKIFSATNPALVIDFVEGTPGETVAVGLRLTEAVPSSAGFNAAVYFPSNVTFSGVVKGSLLASSSFSVQALPLSDSAANVVTLLGYSESQTFSGTGMLCSIMVKVDSGAMPGVYPIILDAPDRSPLVRSCHALSSSDGSSSLAHSAADGRLTVRLPGIPGDSNRNGICDEWEIENFGEITNVTDLTDFDGDGLSDYREYISGTSPTNAQSCVAITGPFYRDKESGEVIIKWYSISGAVYRVERARNDASPLYFSRIGMDQSATPPLNTYRDYFDDGEAGSIFYRIIKLDQ